MSWEAFSKTREVLWRGTRAGDIELQTFSGIGGIDPEEARASTERLARSTCETTSAPQQYENDHFKKEGGVPPYSSKGTLTPKSFARGIWR